MGELQLWSLPSDKVNVLISAEPQRSQLSRHCSAVGTPIHSESNLESSFP